MRSLRHTSVYLRLAFVAMFAFVSLIHGPAMALTMAAGSPPIHISAGVPRDLTTHDHHHHQAVGIVPDQSEAQIPADGTLCPMLGCSIAMGPAAAQPTVTWLLIGRIDALPVLKLRAVILEPADPPPRLSV